MAAADVDDLTRRKAEFALTQLVDAAAPTNQLWGNPAALDSDAFPVRHPLPAAAIWLVLIMAVVVPLAIRRYRTAVVH